MIIADSKFQNMLVSPKRQIRGRVEIYKGSTLISTCGCHDNLVSFTVERAGEKSKFFGYGVCQKLTAKLRDNDRKISVDRTNTLEVEFGVDANYIYPCPLFYVDEVKRDENTNELTLVAYDSLFKATQHTVSELDLPNNPTIADYVRSCAMLLGIPITELTLSGFDTAYPEGANFDGKENIRECLNAIAEATQTIYYIDNNWQLTFKRLDREGNAVFNIDKSLYMKLTNSDAVSLSAITHATELGDNLTAGESSGATQYVRDNPFWNLREDAAALINNGLAAVQGLSITGFECSWRGNFLLEIGDKINLTAKDDSIITTYVLDDTYTFNGGLSAKTRWSYTSNDAETPSNPTTLGESIKQTFARVDKVNKRIDLVVSDVQENSEKIAEINLTLEGIDMSVGEKIEELQGEISAVDEKVAQLSLTVENIDLSVSQVREELLGEISTVDEKVGELSVRADEIALSVEENKTATAADIERIDSNIALIQLEATNITARVEEISTETNQALGDLEEGITNLSKSVETKMTAEDVSIQISQALVNGVEKVETTTGFTFNEEGLTISKSNKEMETTITEDGMTVYRNDEAVLVADNEGVKAEDLHATTYLIVGQHSRFEDFGNRTGCFWIGGIS